MLYLLQQMFIDLNLMEKFHIEVINWVIKPLLLNLVIVNDSFEFKWQKVNGNLLWVESFQVILPAKQAVRCHCVHTAHGTTSTYETLDI